MRSRRSLNEFGVPDFSAPNGLFGDIVDWLIKCANTTVDAGTGCNVLQYNNAIEPGKDGFGVTIKASSTAWQVGDPANGIPSGSSIFAAMNATTDGTNSNMVVSEDQLHVLSVINQGDFLTVVGVAPNTPDGFLQLHM
jgi:hypothetical protein